MILSNTFFDHLYFLLIWEYIASMFRYRFIYQVKFQIHALNAVVVLGLHIGTSHQNSSAQELYRDQIVITSFQKMFLAYRAKTLLSDSPSLVPHGISKTTDMGPVSCW